MAVTKHDRDDYEQGVRDRHLGVFEQVFNDITVQHPDTDAYYKGRRGEELDQDKKDD